MNETSEATTTPTASAVRRSWLVTGVAGFIGYHLARRLLDEGHAVAGIDNLNDYYDTRLKKDRLAQLEGRTGFRFARLDLADRPAVERFFRANRFDRVVHLAAQAGVRYSLTNPYAYVDSNIVGFLSVLEGCRHQGVEHLIYASSSSVYGANTKQPFATSDVVDHPVSLYAATKKSNELMAHAYAHLYGLPVTGLRFFTVYGPWGRPDMALFLFTKAILEGRPIDVFNHGDMERDFTYVDDIIDGVCRVADTVPEPDPDWDGDDPDPSRSAAPFRIFNIGNARPVGLGELIEAIETATGRTAEKRSLPMQPGDVRSTHADVGGLEAAVGYRPRMPVREGVRRFVTWYRDYYNVPTPARPTRPLERRDAPSGLNP